MRDVSKAMRAYYLSRALPVQLGAFAERVVARRAVKAFGQTTRSVLDRLTPNEKLKAVLVSQWGYYGAPPSRSSFAIQALVTKHFMHGGYYPVGGSSEIARTLLKRVADNGGWTRISTDVEEILIENGAAVGVRLKKTGEVLRAKKVVSAAGVLSTVTRLLPESVRAGKAAPWIEDVRHLRAGAGARLPVSRGSRATSARRARRRPTSGSTRRGTPRPRRGGCSRGSAPTRCRTRRVSTRASRA
ncbi:MAG: hypothetical protein IPJ65_27005 [Archangiaceae bacterium]|nr:hypothetical protein [Archangiaceae bacterium]